MRLFRTVTVMRRILILVMCVGTLHEGERLCNCSVTQSYTPPVDATNNFSSSAILLEDSQLVVGAARRDGGTAPGKIYLYDAASTAIQDSALSPDIDAEICRGQFFGETMVRLSDENNPGNRFAVFDPPYCEGPGFADTSGRGYIYEVVNGQFNLLQTLVATHVGDFEFGSTLAYSDGYLFVSGPGA